MISIKNLSKHYNGAIALNSISMNLREGIIFGFVGPNGAGKTTTLNILTYLELPTDGQIEIFGLDHTHNAMAIKKRIGVMPEHLPLFDGLLGIEYLTFIGSLYDLSKDKILNRSSEVFSYFGFKEAAHKFISTYSYGMKKKLSFASAIIHTPEILFLDEPFENVDPISRKKMKDVLKKMRDKGNTVFITSHALAEVEDFCDEVAIINKGKIVYQSETKNIRNKIKNEVTNETYQSLEEIFIDLTTDKDENDKTLSWI